MQSYDDEQNVIRSRQLSGDLEKRAKQIDAELSREDTVVIAIGKLPQKGDIVKLNGLAFEVKFVDYKRGALQLRILKFKEDTEDAEGITHERGELA